MQIKADLKKQIKYEEKDTQTRKLQRDDLSRKQINGIHKCINIFFCVCAIYCEISFVTYAFIYYMRSFYCFVESKEKGKPEEYLTYSNRIKKVNQI